MDKPNKLFIKPADSEEYMPVGVATDAHFDLSEEPDDWEETSTHSISFDVPAYTVRANFVERLRKKQKYPRKLKKKLKKHLSETFGLRVKQIKFVKYFSEVNLMPQ